MVREETLKNIDDYFKNRDILVGNLLDYLKKPVIYYGKSIGLNQIIEWFIDISVSKYYKEIQTKGLSIKYVINTVRKNLLQGGWEVKKRSNIIMTSREINNTQEVINTIKIDDFPRLLITQNKNHKVRPKPKPKIPSKKEKKEVKTSKRGRKRLCEYCGSNIKRRVVNETTHINIGQNPTHHHFCSKECKTKWIYASQMREPTRSEKEWLKNFRTWDQICLDKLKEIGKASLTKWATAMNYINSASISRTAQNLIEQGKIRVINSKTGKVKKYYEAI